MKGRLYALCLVLICVGYAALLTWQEWGFRDSLASPLSLATPITRSPPRAPLDTTAVITVLGLSAENALLPSAEPLTLQASFILGTGLSRALLADGQGARIYQVGDQLPGGSVLRRVEANQAVLWNKGREEVLMLQAPVTRFLHPVGSQSEVQTPAISARYLRPQSGQSE